MPENEEKKPKGNEEPRKCKHCWRYIRNRCWDGWGNGEIEACDDIIDFVFEGRRY